MANISGVKRSVKSKEKPDVGPEMRQWLRQAHVFKALGHFGRMAIVHALAGGELCACELANAAGCSPSTASRHLLVLRHAGLIIDERRGQQIFYRLTCPCVLTFAECLNRIEAGEQVKTLRVACCA
jgi:ArsR family transcriptional regulator